MTDQTPYPDINDDTDLALELLAAATARANGDKAAATDIGRLLERLDGKPTTTAFGFMNAWVRAIDSVAPLPEGTYSRADREPRLDKRWRLADADKGAAIGFRIFAALTNRDMRMALALWQTALTATDQEVQEMAVVAVLHRAGLILARNATGPRPETT